MNPEKILANLDEIVWVYDLDSRRISYLSPSITEICDYSVDELMAKPSLLENLIAPEDFAAAAQVWSNCIQYGRGQMELRLLINGEKRWHLLKGKRTQIEGREVIVGSANDIRMQKGAEAALAQFTQRYDTILQSALTGYILVNLEGYVINCNDAFGKIIDTQIHDITSRHISDFIHPSQPLESSLVARIRNTGRWRGETALMGSAGQLIAVEVAASVIKLHDRDLIVAFVEDISQKDKVRHQLMKVMRHSEEVSRMKTNIMANVTHEIKSPIHRIQGLVKVMSNEFRQTPGLIGYLANIQENSDRVLNSLTAMLEFSRLDSQLARDQFSSVKVCESINELVEQFQDDARAKKLDVNFHLNADQTSVNGDKFLLQESWKILVGNAIKFTEEGKVDISVDEEFEDDGKKIVVRIKDTGRGMSQGFVNRVFEPFSQESQGFNRTFEGLGLGLSIAKRYIESHNGTITLNSEPMKGTEVVIELPGIS